LYDRSAIQNGGETLREGRGRLGAEGFVVNRAVRGKAEGQTSVLTLQDGAPANWLLGAHPDLYLFGSLVEAEMFGVNDERAPLWKARRDEIFDEIEKLSNKTRGAGAMRVMGVTP